VDFIYDRCKTYNTILSNRYHIGKTQCLCGKIVSNFGFMK